MNDEVHLRQLGYEVKQLTKDFAAVAGTVAQELMHPHTGVVVTVRHLQRDLAGLDEQLAVLVTAGLDEHLQVLEDAQAVRQDRRRWVTRDVLVAGLVLIATSVFAAVLTAFIIRN